MSRIGRRQIIIAVIVIIAIILIVGPGRVYYDYYESHVTTDDAYVDGTVALVSSRVAGTCVKLYVEDNWTVHKGQVLLDLDPRDFQVRVDRSRAQLERAKQTVDQLYAGLAAAQAGVKLADDQLRQARIDYGRAEKLREKKVVSSEFYDQATTALRVALANQALTRQGVSQARAALGPDAEDHSRYDRPIVQQAEAALVAARLDLSYTRITAPFSGIVTHKTVHVGNRIQAGEPLMAIVPFKRLYITANFKETQLTDVRVGQSVDITADIYPDHVYKAHVDSISMGTGAAFSLLPPENATGNWVKVVQRVPVKIVLNQPPPPDKPLRLGLSVEAAIDTSNTSGPLLTSEVQSKYDHPGQPNLPNEQLKVPPLHPGIPIAPPSPQSHLQRWRGRLLRHILPRQ